MQKRHFSKLQRMENTNSWKSSLRVQTVEKGSSFFSFWEGALFHSYRQDVCICIMIFVSYFYCRDTLLLELQN